MRIRSIMLTLICVFVTLFSVSCTTQEPQENATSTSTTTPTTAVVIDEKLGEMLTAEEISQALGVTMGAPTVSGQGTILTSIGTDTKTVLNVVVSERPIDIFYMMLQGYPDIQPCPNLGETAWFSAVHNQLLVYGNGFMITVELTGTDDSDQNIQKLRCRQIAALLLEHL